MLPHPTPRPERTLVCTPDQLTASEPHVIVQATMVIPDYFGGGSEEIDWMLSARAYGRIARRQ